MQDLKATTGLNKLIRIYRRSVQGSSFMPSPNFAWVRATTQAVQCNANLEQIRLKHDIEQLQQTNAALTQRVADQTTHLQQINAQLIQVRQLSEHLRETLEADRTRISREIHDQIGQLLTGLKFDIAFIKGRVNNDLIDRQSVQDKAVEMMALIDNAIETVRNIASDLRPGILDDLGLVAALEWHAETFQNRTGVLCEVVSNLPPGPLDRNVSTSLFRIAQEALTNVTRHAQATQVYMTLMEEDDALTFEVRDNGRGICKNDSLATKSLGLLGIEERARLLGGTAQVTGEVSKGTTVAIRIPLDSKCFQTSGFANTNGSEHNSFQV